jgi:hypothetical protein
MLPRNVKDEHLDDGIRELVHTINRIPEIDTMTTCEGHVWRDTPAWPTKDGWIHFVTKKDAYLDLLQNIDYFCQEKGYFSLTDAALGENTLYTIGGHFEPHHDEQFEDLFEKMSPTEQEAYYDRADAHKEILLKDWSALNTLLQNYIKLHIGNLDDLPYREVDTHSENPRRVLPTGCCGNR